MAVSTEQVKQMLQAAKQSPNSEFATELRRRLQSGSYAGQMEQLGFDPDTYMTAEAKNQIQSDLTGNQFEQTPKSFGGKAGDFATTIIGGGELAEGAGLALSANSVLDSLENASQLASQQTKDLIMEIKKRRARGEDTSRLVSALGLNSLEQQRIADAQSDFANRLPSAKQVIGSAARLASTAVAGPLFKGLSKAFGVGRATGSVSKGVRGLATGLTGGAIEGAAQGAGAAAEQDMSAAGIGGGALAGGVIGAGTGGTLGFLGGAGKRLLDKSMSIKQQRNKLIQQGAEDTRAVKFFQDAQGNIQKDKVATEAIKQGVDEGTVTLAKGANEATKAKLRSMLDLKLSGITQPRRALLERPASIAGESALQRFNAVAKLNKEAASRLDDVAEGLRGISVNPEPAVVNFINDLEDLGVQFQNGQAVFPENSALSGLTEAQNLVNRVVNRLSAATDDAFELHQIKKFIDEQVAFGKTSGGLAGTTETVIKNLRRSIDDILDNNFPEYNQVNTQFSKTRQAIDDFGDVAGKTFDPQSPSVNENAGNLLRRITSNARTRTDVIDSLQLLQDTAEQYGVIFDDDLITQVDFFTELERLFGTSARTSLQGQIENVLPRAADVKNRSLIDLGIDATQGAIRASRDINEEALERSLKELLE